MHTSELLEKMWWIIGITIGCRFHNRMTASDEDPVSRGKNNKKKDGGKGNKKEEKKNKTEKKEATKEPKKAEGKASKTPPASTNPPAEKKNKGTADFSFFSGGCVDNVQLFFLIISWLFPGKKGNGDNKHPSGKGSSEARNVNEVESTDGAEESGQNSPVDFATLDQSCLVDADNNNSPVVQAPAIPHGSGIKYIRLVFSK